MRERWRAILRDAPPLAYAGFLAAAMWVAVLIGMVAFYR